MCGARNKKTRNLVPLVMSSADGSSADSDTSREHEGVALAANAQGLGGAEHTGVGLISDATRILVINIRAPRPNCLSFETTWGRSTARELALRKEVWAPDRGVLSQESEMRGNCVRVL